MRSILVFVAFLLAVFLVAAIGGIATASGVRDWYPSLNKSAWNPPAWIFGPVWTVLYLSIAVAGFLAWRAAGFRGAKWVMVVFTLQLMLNAAWSWIFFGLRQPGWAFVEITLLWLAIVVTAIALFRVSRVGGTLFLPYLLWVTFAAALNFAIWRLNVAH
jgi:tryptophan-rich sensory protein